MDDASIDVVVSFETIEHISEHEAFVHEVRRVLRPGGLFVVSTPDRDIYSGEGAKPNPFHCRELGEAEFISLLARDFAHYRIGRQKATAGSVILPPGDTLDEIEVFSRLGVGCFESAPIPLRAPYLLAVASDTHLSSVRWGVLDDAAFLVRIQQRVIGAEGRLNSEVGRLGAEILRVNEAYGVRTEEVRTLNMCVADLRAHFARAREAYEERASALEAAIAGREEVVGALRGQLAEREEESGELRGRLASQTRALTEAEQQLRAVYASTSWRLTRSIRFFKLALFGGTEGRRVLRERLDRHQGKQLLAASATVPSHTAPADPTLAASATVPAHTAPADPRPLLLIVTHDCSRTGAPVVCLNLTRELTRRGDHRVVCIAMMGGALAGSFAELAPTHLLNAGRPGVPAAVALSEILNMIGETSSAAALCSTVVTAPLLPSLRAAGIRVISLVHELPTSILYYGEETIWTVQAEAEVIVFASAYVQDRVTEAFGGGRARHVIIPTGYPLLATNLSDPARERRGMLADMASDEEPFLVVACGTLDHRKGPDLFLQVAARVARCPAGQRARFVWIGDADDALYFSWLRHDVQLLGLTQVVQFAGSSSDVDPQIGAADVFLLPSREDPYPLVNIAALGAGVPVVAFAGAGGAPEAFGSTAGIVVPYLDVDAMAEAVLRLIADQALRQRLSVSGRHRFEAEHTMGVFVDRLLALLGDVRQTAEPER